MIGDRHGKSKDCLLPNKWIALCADLSRDGKREHYKLTPGAT